MRIDDCIEQIKATATYNAYAEAAKLIEHNTQEDAIAACEMRASTALRKAQRFSGDGAIKMTCGDALDILAELSGADLDALLGLNGRQAS